MDVTPKLLEDVEFREKFRGYDPEEVDEFLERVAVAFGQLQDSLRSANEQLESANSRAARAEARARQSADTDETLRRTLVLAQRTADAAVKEAEEQAASIIAAAEAQARQHVAAADERAVLTAERAAAEAAETQRIAVDAAATVRDEAEAEAEATLGRAREQAGRLLVEARQKADRVVADAETAAIRQAEERLARLTEDIAAGERRRDALAHDLNALDAHAMLQRRRLSAAVEQLTGLLDEPSGLGELSLPELTTDSFEHAIAAHLARVDTPAPAPAPVIVEAAAPATATPASADEPADAPRSGVGDTTTVVPTAESTTSRADDTTADATAGGAAPADTDDAEGVARRPVRPVSVFDRVPDVSGGATAASDAGGDSPSTGETRSPSSRAGLFRPAPASEPAAARVAPPAERGAGVPPWAGMTPPPPPPPPPSAPAAAAAGVAVSDVPPPPAPPEAPAPDSAVQAETVTTAVKADPFLDELRRAVGDEADDDEAVRFFEDRDPTDPALRFFETGEDARSRFRRR